MEGQAVNNSKLDYCLIAVLACDIRHRNNDLTFDSIRNFRLDEGGSGQAVAGAASRPGWLLAERAETEFAKGIRFPQCRRGEWTAVPAEITGKKGFSAEDARWLSQ